MPRDQDTDKCPSFLIRRPKTARMYLLWQIPPRSHRLLLHPTITNVTQWLGKLGLRCFTSSDWEEQFLCPSPSGCAIVWNWRSRDAPTQALKFSFRGKTKWTQFSHGSHLLCVHYLWALHLHWKRYCVFFFSVVLCKRAWGTPQIPIGGCTWDRKDFLQQCVSMFRSQEREKKRNRPICGPENGKQDSVACWCRILCGVHWHLNCKTRLQATKRMHFVHMAPSSSSLQEPVTIAAFNIQVFGTSKASKADTMDILKRVFLCFFFFPIVKDVQSIGSVLLVCLP